MPYANFLIIIYNGKQRKHTEITEILGDSFRSVLSERFHDSNRKTTSISVSSELFLFHFRYGESFKNYLKMPYANVLIIIYNGKQRKQTETTEIFWGGGSVLCLLKDFVTQTEKQPQFPFLPNDFCFISVMVNHSRTI